MLLISLRSTVLVKQVHTAVPIGGGDVTGVFEVSGKPVAVDADIALERLRNVLFDDSVDTEIGEELFGLLGG